MPPPHGRGHENLAKYVYKQLINKQQILHFAQSLTMYLINMFTFDDKFLISALWDDKE